MATRPTKKTAAHTKKTAGARKSTAARPEATSAAIPSTFGGVAGISRLSNAVTRSASAENFDAAKGGGGRSETGTGQDCARELGVGWKVSPSVRIPAGTTHTLADIDGEGVIQHIWCTTHPTFWRQLVLRVYYEGDSEPAIETPLGDFFCSGWKTFAQVSSLPISVNPHGGFNSYFEMPFRANARVTVENIAPEDVTLYYQVDFSLGEVAPDAAYLHAQFRRSNPLPYATTHTLLDNVQGSGHYVGTYIGWQVNNTGWWGEGEIKFYLDGDNDFPTIAGTGTEDYFGGAWDFEVPGQGYTQFSTPYLGFHQVIRPDGLYQAQQRFGMYRWHLADPIRFAADLSVDIQALGWRSEHRYLPLQDDISSVAYFYLDATSTNRPALPDRNGLEVI
jgi:Protein of unknown function (DUF2961)